jgi:hypothetical protein
VYSLGMMQVDLPADMTEAMVVYYLRLILSACHARASQGFDTCRYEPDCRLSHPLRTAVMARLREEDGLTCSASCGAIFVTWGPE